LNKEVFALLLAGCSSNKVPRKVAQIYIINILYMGALMAHPFDHDIREFHYRNLLMMTHFM